MYMLYTNRQRRDPSKRPEIRRIRVVHYAYRSGESLRDYIRELLQRSSGGSSSSSGGGTLSSADLSQLLTAGPLWRLLFSAAQDDLLLEDEVRSLLQRILCEGVVRMRSTTKILARDIVGLPYFSREGALARNIKGLARDR
jgi:hypothetical protein